MRALDPYPDGEARDAELGGLAAQAGGEVVCYGTSVEGRPLLAARLPAAASGVSLRLLAAANIHGPEMIASRVVLGLLARARDWGPLQRLRERAELWLIPCLNPDAYARCYARDGHGRMTELRPNANGVDLNRNFPLPLGRPRRRLPGAGSLQPGAATYVGQAPLSEPETAALVRLMTEQRFHAVTSGHSFMGTTIPAHVEDRASFRTYRDFCRAFAAAQPRARYRRLASRFFDTFTGELEDHMHHAHGAWAICVETFPLGASLRQHLRAPSLFWRMNPRDPDPWIANDVPGITAFFQAAVDTPRPGAA